MLLFGLYSLTSLGHMDQAMDQAFHLMEVHYVPTLVYDW